MRSRLVLYLAVAVALVAVGLAAFRLTPSTSSTPAVVHASLPPKANSYLGVYESGAPPGFQPIADFTKAVGAQPNLAGYFSGWAEPFDTAFADGLQQHGVIPFVQIDPTFASVAGVAAGHYDTYLRSYADSVRSFGHPVVIGFGHEMNAPTYSWGYGRTSPATFIAAWRHIWNLFQTEGAKNVTWLWTINADRPGTGPIQSWWPGAKYVTWVGIDGYYYRPSDTFDNVFGTTMKQVGEFTGDSILLSETAVGPRAGQNGKISNLFDGISQYHALGLVWFDKAQDSGVYHQDWRLEGDAAAESAFALGVSGLNLVRP